MESNIETVSSVEAILPRKDPFLFFSFFFILRIFEADIGSTIRKSTKKKEILLRRILRIACVVYSELN